ncbi:MAG: sigma-54-dependent transcriptional regulator [Candidatus Brocadiales bacterium]
MHKKLRILFVDDEKTYREVMKKELTLMGHSVVGVENGERAMEQLSQRDFDVVVLDMMLPGTNGVETLKMIKQEDYPVEVIMLTGQGTVETAVESMKLGAYDYITKPSKLSELETLIKKAYERGQLTRENISLKRLVNGKTQRTSILGKSPAIKEVFKLMDKVAGTDSTVLLQGESGTGKELVAMSIHAKSMRVGKPFVVVNCAALQETLLESELFGHAKGAFTGAHETRMGLFEAADGGTVFLDEIGEMSPNTQSKFLRVLQSGEMRRVGENRVIGVDVRVIAATNKDLHQEVKEDRFREDLFYRLNTITINIPPLRERKEDIPILAEYFINLYKERGFNKRIDKKTMKMLTNYMWPGNVRELQNTIERTVILSDGDTIENWTLPDYFCATPFGEKLPEDIPLAELERRYIHHILAEKKGNKAQTAQVLGISLKTLYNKLKEYNMST